MRRPGADAVGVYVYQLQAGPVVHRRKMLLVK